MITHSRVFSITTTPFIIDLSLLAEGDVNSGSLARQIADFSIEVDGNTANAVFRAKGGNTSSGYKTVADGTAASGGALLSIKGFQLTHLEVVCAGTLPFPVYVTRRIGD